MWQIKIVDQFRILTAITTVLEKRIAKSPHKGYTGVVPINLYCVTIVLAFTDGVITCVKQKPSARAYSKMLLGYRSLYEIETEYLDVKINTEYRELMCTLFQKAKAHIHSCY